MLGGHTDGATFGVSRTELIHLRAAIAIAEFTVKQLPHTDPSCVDGMRCVRDAWRVARRLTRKYATEYIDGPAGTFLADVSVRPPRLPRLPRGD